jgi:hypothetical protein
MAINPYGNAFPTPKRGFLRASWLDENKQTKTITIKFQYNPAQITDRRPANYATIEAPGRVTPGKQYSHGGERTITFSIHLDGFHQDTDISIERDAAGGITPELNKYRALIYPATADFQKAPDKFWDGFSFLPLYKTQTQFVSPPICTLAFGEDRVIDCVVTEVSISETMFNTEFQPVRADVSLTLVEIQPYDDPKPASGGSGATGG